MVSTSTWTVSEAVNQVLLAIQQGSTLKLNVDASGPLHDWYTLGFQAQHDKGADWDHDKAVILPLAHWVGLTATLFTAVRAVVTGSGAPAEVDPECALKAAYLISLECHFKLTERSAAGGPKLLPDGVYCPLPPPSYQPSPEELAQADHLRELRKLLLPSLKRAQGPAAA